MWKHTLIAITTLAALTSSVNAHPSHQNEVDAAIGGLITGVILSELVDDANLNIHLAARYGDSWNRYDSDYRSGNYRSYENYRVHGKSGHYVWEKRRIWVPGHWDYIRNRRGHEVRIWLKGHHEVQKFKVWISDHHDNHRRGDRYYDNRREERYCR